MLLCSASTCGIFSLIGIFFLISVGIMLEVQPLYIKGIKDHTPDEVATACYEGAAIYAATFIVSVGYIYYKKGASSSRRGESAVLIGEANQSNYDSTSTRDTVVGTELTAINNNAAQL